MTESPPELRVEPLIPQRLADLAALFGQGGDPKWCWCASFHLRRLDFNAATPESNRKVFEASAKAAASERRARGLIAYRDGEPIGWVSLGPRGDYDRLAHSKVLAPVDEEPVWSIVCFVVGRRARGHGVATALLAAAISYARDHGAEWLEAYPADTAAGRISSANAYKGTLSMFERVGFKVAARRQANRASPVRPIVRLRL